MRKTPSTRPPLRKLIASDDLVTLVVSDITRAWMHQDQVVGLLVPFLHEECGVPYANMVIVIALGTHRPNTEDEMKRLVTPEVYEEVRVVNHDCDAPDLVYIGTTSRGTRVEGNPLAVGRKVILIGGTVHHLMAGFGGGRKSVLPGISSRQTIRRNHERALSPTLPCTDEKVGSGKLPLNPIHEDMAYAARKVGLAFILNVAMDAEKHIVAAFAGDCIQAHARGCAFVSDMCGVDKVTSDIVITTNSGYPLDQNLYQTPKGVSTAAACAGEDGVLILGASLCDGVGGTNFEKLMRLGSPQVIKDTIEAIPPKESIPEQWCAQIYARLLLQHPIIIVTQHMDPRELEAMGFQAAASFDQALEMAFRLKGPDASVTVIPDGVSVIVRS